MRSGLNFVPLASIPIVKIIKTEKYVCIHRGGVGDDNEVIIGKGIYYTSLSFEQEQEL